MFRHPSSLTRVEKRVTIPGNGSARLVSETREANGEREDLLDVFKSEMTKETCWQPKLLPNQRWKMPSNVQSWLVRFKFIVKWIMETLCALLLHLKTMNTSTSFWNCVKTGYAEWEEVGWLRVDAGRHAQEEKELYRVGGTVLHVVIVARSTVHAHSQHHSSWFEAWQLVSERRHGRENWWLWIGNKDCGWNGPEKDHMWYPQLHCTGGFVWSAEWTQFRSWLVVIGSDYVYHDYWQATFSNQGCQGHLQVRICWFANFFQENQGEQLRVSRWYSNQRWSTSTHFLPVEFTSRTSPIDWWSVEAQVVPMW